MCDFIFDRHYCQLNVNKFTNVEKLIHFENHYYDHNMPFINNEIKKKRKSNKKKNHLTTLPLYREWVLSHVR